MTSRALLVVVALLAWAPSALAHDTAMSSFAARTYGKALQVRFQLDATSVVDLIERKTNSKPGKEAIVQHDKLIQNYVLQGFAISNKGVRCKSASKGRVSFAKDRDKVVTEIRFECSKPASSLRIESTLFNEEDTPHRLIGTVRHGESVERYFFSRKDRVVTLELAALGGASRSAGRATPPPGAFAKPSASPAPPVSTPPEAAPAEKTAPSSSRGVLAFIWEGVTHIFGGLDHILFVVCLVLAVRNWRELAIVITSFTLAHSITLLLVALGLLTLSPRIVEPIIAASIVFVAVENVVREEPKHRYVLTFIFGLLHGLGFGAALRQLALETGDTALLLFGFNVGVEIGQLLIVAPLFPLVLWLRKREVIFRRVTVATCVIAGLIATFWFVERVIT